MRINVIQTVEVQVTKSNLVDPGGRSRLLSASSAAVTKKKVVWADSFSKQLEHVQLFYLDETEKGTVPTLRHPTLKRLLERKH
jgi:hypothetical protein